MMSGLCSRQLESLVALLAILILVLMLSYFCFHTIVYRACDSFVFVVRGVGWVRLALYRSLPSVLFVRVLCASAVRVGVCGGSVCLGALKYSSKNCGTPSVYQYHS